MNFSRNLALALVSSALVQPLFAQTQTPFDSSLTRIAEGYLDQRARALQAIQTRPEAEARTKRFRAFVMDAIGGLPQRSPLNAKALGSLDEDGFLIQKVIYDSLPGFHVTANLFLPKSGHGPLPAVLYTPGHYPMGKVEAWNLAGNMARNGIAVLVYDPIGEGERLQYFDPASGKSLAGQPTGEHTEASVQIALTGEHIARYFIWDAMRGLDYLESREDIDATRLGALGCSGGGTVTAYLAALDPRVKAAGVACYITSYNALLGTIGPQEAEQTIPGFIKEGFDFPDWIEAAAPMPYAVISTTEDMFPFAGARASVEEAKRINSLYGATDQLQWITGPGRHGNLGPIHAQIVGFFLKALARSDAAPSLVPLGTAPAPQLMCTNTGQVSTSLGGETLFTVNRAEARGLLGNPPEIRTSTDLAAFHSRLAQMVRAATGAEVLPGTTTLDLAVTSTEKRNSYVLQNVRFTSVTGEQLTGVVAIPAQAGKRAATLLLDQRSGDDLARDGGELDRLASAGSIVFAPGLPPGTPDDTAPKTPLLGPFYIASLRAQLVGKTLVGFRVDDAIRCLNWLISRPDVDASQISGWASGAMGIVLLHTAALDSRLNAITLDSTLISYRSAVDAAVPRDLAQSVISGVLRHYDLEDLIVAGGSRRVLIKSPVDGAGNPISAADSREALSWAFATERTLRQSPRLQIDVETNMVSPPGK